MTKAIGQVTGNPDTVPGGGDVYDGRVFETIVGALNHTRGVTVNQQEEIAALQAQTESGLTGLAPRGINPVEAASSVGTGPNVAYDDHAHGGLSEVTVPGPATLTGALTFSGDLTAIGNSLTFGAGNLKRNFPFGTPKSVVCPYAVLSTDFLVLVTGAVGTVTLPAANVGAAGWAVVIVNNQAVNSYTVAAGAGDTIQGNASTTLQPFNGSHVYCSAIFISDGVHTWTSLFWGG